MNITHIIGISAAVITSVAQLPQLIKMIREKKATDISIWMLLILMAGLALWSVYGYLQKDWPIMITNAFSFFINLLVTFLRYFFKKPGKS